MIKAMKNLKIYYRKLCLSLLTISLLYACGGGEGNTGGNWTEIDSTEDTAAVEMSDEIHFSDERSALTMDSSVKVEMEENTDFNWIDFRNKLQAQPEAIGEGYHLGTDEVATSWEKYNDYSYQTLYRYQDNELWLQTYYRDSTTEGADSLSNEGTLLTKDVKDPGLQELWKKMEEKARELSNGNLD
jgi:hypothetical protein